jgi:hypothetical protein
MSPESIVLDVSKGVWNNKLPAVEASCIPMCDTVPHEAVAVGNVMSALFCVTPLDGASNVADVLAYEPPDTSVPESASVGSVVYRDTYTVAGDVYVVALKVALINAFSRKLLNSAIIVPYEVVTFNVALENVAPLSFCLIFAIALSYRLDHTANLSSFIRYGSDSARVAYNKASGKYAR